MSTRRTDTICTSPSPDKRPPSSSSSALVSRRKSIQQRDATGRVRQPASPRQNADLRQPASRMSAPAKQSRRAGDTDRDDDHAEVQAQAREQARAEARRRAQARVRLVDAASVRHVGFQQRAARGMPMDRLSLPLRELHERHARLARTLNKSGDCSGEGRVEWLAGEEGFKRGQQHVPLLPHGRYIPMEPSERGGARRSPLPSVVCSTSWDVR